MGFNFFKISFVLEALGSLISIFWNLRSKALSFSKNLVYSSVVVAPIILILERARAGFNILEASMAPSAPPAPINVCISSINKIKSG